MFSVAHLSDLHATPARFDGLGPMLNKRLLGWLSWRTRRHRYHRPAVLDALLDDLSSAAPDHVVVTGDLTNTALPAEFEGARRWLERIGPPERVSLVPGNHDAYVAVPPEQGVDLWSAYMRSDGGPVRFPTLRRRGPLAVIGLSSAVATPPFRATGRVGPDQLARLDELLAGLAGRGAFRLVLLHHPPVAGVVSGRRALLDAAELRDVLRRHGAELVLHGHTHRECFEALEGPAGPIPVVGVRSASDAGQRPGRRAQYHLYQLERDSGAQGFRVHVRVRGYDGASGRFAAVAERTL